MTVLWCILAAIVLLVILVLSLRLGIRAVLAQSLTVVLRIGPKTIPLYPAAEKTPKTEKQTATAKAPAAKKARPNIDLTSPELKGGLQAVWEALQRVLRRVGKRIRIDPYQVSIIVGGTQPDRVAELYGQVSGAVWTVMPRLEQLIHIRDPYIHLDVDFHAPAVNVEGQMGAYLRVGDLIAIAFAAAVPLLKWYIPFRRRQKAREKLAAQNTAPTTQP